MQISGAHYKHTWHPKIAVNIDEVRIKPSSALAAMMHMQVFAFFLVSLVGSSAAPASASSGQDQGRLVPLGIGSSFLEELVDAEDLTAADPPDPADAGTKASSEEQAVGEARQEALLSHPANFNLRAGLIASAKANAAGKKRRRGIVELLDQALRMPSQGLCWTMEPLRMAVVCSMLLPLEACLMTYLQVL